MHELQQKDKKVVLNAKALETIYHTASSSIGKLISGRQYLGGYALDQVRDKVEVEGKELPFRSGTVHKNSGRHDAWPIINIQRNLKDQDADMLVTRKHQRTSLRSWNTQVQ